MSRRPRSSVETSVLEYDPTPEEVAKAERAKPLKRPLCMKCKDRDRIMVWETVKHQIDDAFRKIEKMLKSSNLSRLSRDDMERLRNGHRLLARASRAQYCEPCVTNTVSYVLETMENLGNTKPR